MDMKGLTSTSSMIAISGALSETAPNTFTQQQVDLQLNPLDNEVFVVFAVDINLTPPDADVSLASTTISSSVSTTSRTGLGTIGDSNVLAEAQDKLVNDTSAGVMAAFSRKAGETPTSDLPYIAIISSNDFFVQLEGRGNTDAKAVSYRLWGARYRATASVYAALLQSEILSA